MRGQITAGGKAHGFDYSGGRTIVSSNNMPEPVLGRHTQPSGFELKVPRVGDSVVFTIIDSGVQWGYAEHYVDASLRRAPSEFRSIASILEA